MTTIDIVAVLADRVAAWDAVARLYGRRVVLAVPRPVPCAVADPDHLVRRAGRLVAAELDGAADTVTVTVAFAAGGVRMTVTGDHAPAELVAA